MFQLLKMFFFFTIQNLKLANFKKTLGPIKLGINFPPEPTQVNNNEKPSNMGRREFLQSVRPLFTARRWSLVPVRVSGPMSGGVLWLVS